MQNLLEFERTAFRVEQVVTVISGDEEVTVEASPFYVQDYVKAEMTIGSLPIDTNLFPIEKVSCKVYAVYTAEVDYRIMTSSTLIDEYEF